MLISHYFVNFLLQAMFLITSLDTAAVRIALSHSKPFTCREFRWGLSSQFSPSYFIEETGNAKLQILSGSCTSIKYFSTHEAHLDTSRTSLPKSSYNPCKEIDLSYYFTTSVHFLIKDLKD
jgi:hypothetical protein